MTIPAFLGIKNLNAIIHLDLLIILLGGYLDLCDTKEMEGSEKPNAKEPEVSGWKFKPRCLLESHILGGNTFNFCN